MQVDQHRIEWVLHDPGVRPTTPPRRSMPLDPQGHAPPASAESGPATETPAIPPPSRRRQACTPIRPSHPPMMPAASTPDGVGPDCPTESCTGRSRDASPPLAGRPASRPRDPSRVAVRRVTEATGEPRQDDAGGRYGRTHHGQGPSHRCSAARRVHRSVGSPGDRVHAVAFVSTTRMGSMPRPETAGRRGAAMSSSRWRPDGGAPAGERNLDVGAPQPDAARRRGTMPRPPPSRPGPPPGPHRPRP